MNTDIKQPPLANPSRYIYNKTKRFFATSWAVPLYFHQPTSDNLKRLWPQIANKDMFTSLK
jgi:hypothetical protein